MKKLKPIYVTIETVDGHATVRGIYPWLWIAKLMARADKLEAAIIPQDPQEIINICEHRDKALNDRIAALNEQNAALSDRSILLDTIFSLVARDDNGVWTTVHDADTPVAPETAEALSLVLA